MSDLLLYYQRPEPSTWVFLSSFLLLGIYFVFHRFFSIRNLDLLLLLLLAPGLMMVYEGRKGRLTPSETPASSELADKVVGNPHRDGLYVSTPVQQPSAEQLDGYQPTAEEGWSAGDLEFWGFAAILLACFLLMIRMLVDPALVRRPLLVPNLTIGGMSFIGISLFLFLMANVITSTPQEQHQRSPQLGPGYALLDMLPALPTIPETDEGTWPEASVSQGVPWLPNVARILAILSNLAIITGIVCVGYWHFDNVKTGIGCAVMYLLLPYTAQMTGDLQHTMPAAMLVLALLMYRQPLLSGLFLGLAAGLVYYPLFLLPLWISFYWHRGLARLLAGFGISLVSLIGLLLLEGFDVFGERITQMFGIWLPRMEGLEGIWGPGRIEPDFRLPVLVACILLAASYAFWPSRKNFGTLICGTAAIMLAVQFWHGFGGGLFMAWFLPFILLTIFRPNLDDRIAVNVVRLSRPTQVSAVASDAVAT